MWPRFDLSRDLRSVSDVIIVFVPPGSKDLGVKNKLEWLRVDFVHDWKSLVKEDWIEPMNRDTVPLE